MTICGIDLIGFLEYETEKVVHFQNFYYGAAKRIIQSVAGVLILFTLFFNQRYQKSDPVMSSVHVKVKGVAESGRRVWDTAEYAVPGQGANSFFVLTNIITTENQAQGLCPEFPLAKALCTTDKNCTKDHVAPQGNGIQTGKCVKYNDTVNTCEVSAWCPVESGKAAPTPAILDSAENFTILIKNNIHFPYYDYTKRNIPPDFNVSCVYNKHGAPLCPIFRLGDVLEEAGETFSEVAVQGGIIGIEINWDCNLDLWGRCRPEYSFRRLDDKRASEALYPGYNFRFARYYKKADGKEERTLIKAYGIRFDVLIFGAGRKWSILEIVVYIGSSLSYLAAAQIFVDCLFASYGCCPCCKSKPVKQYYYNRKYQTLLGPRWSLFYVAFVDMPHILMMDSGSKASLQNQEGKIVEKTPGDLMQSPQLPDPDPCNRPTNPEERQPLPDPEAEQPLPDPEAGQPLPDPEAGQPLPDPEAGQPLPDPEGMQLVPNPSRGRGRLPGPSWCCCGNCWTADEPFWEQLCCRKSAGVCISTSPLFEQLVLSRSVLQSVLLYRDPFLNLEDRNATKLFRHCAYERYIHWRFGRGDLADRAVIPNCCRRRIRDGFPSENRVYTGLQN